ncbi:MAG: hypothetical protein ABW169_14015 [Sphingobium sp.]
MAIQKLDQTIGSPERMAGAVSQTAGALSQRTEQLQNLACQFANGLRDEGQP